MAVLAGVGGARGKNGEGSSEEVGATENAPQRLMSLYVTRGTLGVAVVGAGGGDAWDELEEGVVPVATSIFPGRMESFDVERALEGLMAQHAPEVVVLTLPPVGVARSRGATVRIANILLGRTKAGTKMAMAESEMKRIGRGVLVPASAEPGADHVDLPQLVMWDEGVWLDDQVGLGRVVAWQAALGEARAAAPVVERLKEEQVLKGRKKVSRTRAGLRDVAAIGAALHLVSFLRAGREWWGRRK